MLISSSSPTKLFSPTMLHLSNYCVSSINCILAIFYFITYNWPYLMTIQKSLSWSSFHITCFGWNSISLKYGTTLVIDCLLVSGKRAWKKSNLSQILSIYRSDTLFKYYGKCTLKSFLVRLNKWRSSRGMIVALLHLSKVKANSPK